MEKSPDIYDTGIMLAHCYLYIKNNDEVSRAELQTYFQRTQSSITLMLRELKLMGCIERRWTNNGRYRNIVLYYATNHNCWYCKPTLTYVRPGGTVNFVPPVGI